jgi:hypothetical protein
VFLLKKYTSAGIEHILYHLFSYRLTLLVPVWYYSIMPAGVTYKVATQTKNYTFGTNYVCPYAYIMCILLHVRGFLGNVT